MDLKNEHINSLSSLDYWRLAIDGAKQTKSTSVNNQGWIAWEGRELGSLGAMLRAFNFMFSTINQPLSVKLIQQFHFLAMQGVFFLREINLGIFREKPTSFQIPLGITLSDKGLNYIKEYEQNTNKLVAFTLITKSSVTNESEFCLKLYSAEISQNEIASVIKKIIHDYENEKKRLETSNISKEEKDNQKLLMIINCVQQLEWLHPFQDGNCRVLCVLVLNKLLIENGFTPVILEDPNQFDGFSPNELINVIKKGMKSFQNAHKLMPHTKDIITEQIENFNKGPKAFFGDNLSPLHLAIFNGLTDIALSMISTQKFDINAKNNIGTTPLMMAAFYGDNTLVSALLKRDDIDINAKDNNGMTAAMWAATIGHEAIMKTLMLHKNANKDNEIIVQRLFSEYKPDVNDKSIIQTLKNLKDKINTLPLHPCQNNPSNINTLWRLTFGAKDVLDPGRLLGFYFYIIKLDLQISQKNEIINHLAKKISQITGLTDYPSVLSHLKPDFFQNDFFISNFDNASTLKNVIQSILIMNKVEEKTFTNLDDLSSYLVKENIYTDNSSARKFLESTGFSIGGNGQVLISPYKTQYSPQLFNTASEKKENPSSDNNSLNN